MNSTSFINQNKFQKVDKIEPKRSFIIAQLIRNMNRGNTRYLSKLSNEELQSRLKSAKEIVFTYTDKELDKRIYEDSPRHVRRLRFYNSSDWYTGEVNAHEVGVWHGAGGLPEEWTYGSLVDTAGFVKKARLDKDSKKISARSKRALDGIFENINIIENEKYLYPIILPPATNGRGIDGMPRKNFKIMKGDIDDGCMRAIAFVNSEKTSFNAYIGINPPK